MPLGLKITVWMSSTPLSSCCQLNAWAWSSPKWPRIDLMTTGPQM